VTVLQTGIHGISGHGVIPVTQMVSGAMGFQPADVPKAESDCLIALYNLTNGSGWTNSLNWLSDPIVGNWFGVTVAGGHVTQVNLDNNNLVGSLATWSPDCLPSLTHLYLYTNAGLIGDISGWVLPNSLVHLQLLNTNVSGDISGWTLPNSLAYLHLGNTNVSGDISGWTLPNSLADLYLFGTNVSGDVSGWTLPNSLVYLSLNGINVSGDISGWTLSNSLTHLHLLNTNVSGTPDISGNTAMQQYYYHNCNLTQANVDAVLLGVYNRRMAFTFATPTLLIHGTNAAPSGVYGAMCPPTTGKEYAFELVNDSCGDGFITWTVTFTP